ncbi:MATE family efflux transporter [Vibrio metschnikovii]
MVAAHQVALSFSSLVFVILMSIGAAVSIRVGHTIGQHNLPGAAVASNVGLMVGVAASLLTATFTLIFRQEIALLYTNNTEVITLAMQLLILAGIYQCVDAIQVVAAGALRGYKDMAAIFNRTFYCVLDFRFTDRLCVGDDRLDC